MWILRENRLIARISSEIIQSERVVYNLYVKMYSVREKCLKKKKNAPTPTHVITTKFYLDSGMTCATWGKQNKIIVALCFYVSWRVDKEYMRISYSVRLWVKERTVHFLHTRTPSGRRFCRYEKNTGSHSAREHILRNTIS